MFAYKNRVLIVWLAIAGGLLCGEASAEVIGAFEIVRHEFCGSGSADLTDAGLPPQSDEFCNLGGPPDTVGGGFWASDRTQPGSLGAGVEARGGSTTTPLTGGGLLVNIQIIAIYRPSAFPGGSNPGGVAEGEFMSVLEFLLPSDGLTAPYQFRIDQDFPFDGSASVEMENMTQSFGILNLDAHVGVSVTPPLGEAGDLIRITSMMQGSGSMGPGSRKEYEAFFELVLLPVPEPSTALMLFFGTLMTTRRVRRERILSNIFSRGRMGFRRPEDSREFTPMRRLASFRYAALIALPFFVTGISSAEPRNVIVGVDAELYLEFNSATGAAHPVTGVGQGEFDNIQALAFDRNTNTLYSMSAASDQLIAIDPDTGIGTEIGSMSCQMVSALAFDPNANVLYAAPVFGTDLVAIDLQTAECSVVGQFGQGLVLGMAFDDSTNTLYGADSLDYSLIAFNTVTGVTQTIGSLGTTGDSAVMAMAFDSNNHKLYGLQIETNQLLAIDPDTAAITFIGPPAFNDRQSLAFDSGSNTLFAMNEDTFQLVTLDIESGLETPVTPLGFDNIRGLAFDPDSYTLYGSTVDFFGTGQLITINPRTGASTVVGDLGFRLVEGLAFDANSDTLYGSDIFTDQLITIDTATGVGTEVGALGINSVRGLAFDAATDTLYGADTFGNQLVAIDVATGAGTPVGPLDFGFVDGLAFDHQSNTLYGTEAVTDQLLVIDPVSGSGTAVGDAEFDNIKGLAVVTVEFALDDFAGMVECAAGVGEQLPDEACHRFDFDEDEDVDLIDFGAFQHTFTGSIYGS